MATKKHPKRPVKKARKLAPVTNADWIRNGIVLHKGAQCAWFVKRTAGVRKDRYVPLDTDRGESEC